mgnify:CR=1 FL=1
MTLTTEKIRTNKIVSCLLLIFALVTLPAHASDSFTITLNNAMESNELDLSEIGRASCRERV